MKKAILPLSVGFSVLAFSVSDAASLADMEGADALVKVADVEPSGSCTMVDFETLGEKVAYAALPFRRPRMAVVADFATSGEKAFRASWDANHRMGFTIKIPATDFTPFDRLVIDVVNAGPEPDQLNLHVAAAGEKLDDSVYTANGLRGCIFAPVGSSTWVVELTRWPKKAEKSRTKISELRFYALHPCGTTMHFDNIRLLKKGEPLVPGAYRPEDAAKIAALVKGVAERDGAARAAAKASLKDAMTAAGMAVGQMLVGTATPMEHLLPKDPAALAKVRPAAALRLRLARGEYESAQLIVAPLTGVLHRVSVACSDLVCREGRAAGTTLAASNVACAVTGYSRTLYQAPYAVGRTVFTNAADRAGYQRKGFFPQADWYPDVILGHVRAADVAEDTAQGFWVRVQCPRDQPAGVYCGELAVSAEGAAPVRIPFMIGVNGFTLPKTAALPVAMNFHPSGDVGWLPTDAEYAERRAAKDDPLAPRNIWKKRQMEWADFLADYLIPYDFLYRVSHAAYDSEPNWDILMRLKAQGRLAPFTLAYWGQIPEGGKGVKKWNRSLPYYRRICGRAKELGILDYGFFYGNDECNPNEFPAIRRAADLIHKEFPGVPLFTTSRDFDFGIGTNSLENVDWFCPLTGRYDFKRAEKARAKGRKIWWYVCDGPTWNCANLHIENKPIDARLLLGAQSVFFKADGFLYWQLGKWHSPRTIGTDPFTDWVAASCFGFNGEGCLTAAGPDGIPLPTVRLENFRDGLEDYAYVTILKEKIQARGKEDEWAHRARELVAVPPWLVKALDCFNDDPAALAAWREAMADLIEN